MTAQQRMTLFRLILAVVWAAVGIALFISFRSHTLLIDNKEVEGFPAPDIVSVSLDGKKPALFLRGDRDRFTVTGRRHRIRVEFNNGSAPLEKRFTLPVKNDIYLLSIPQMTGGKSVFVEPFTAQQPARNSDPEPDGGADTPAF